MLLEEAEEWKKDRSWTRTRDGISLDLWYSIQSSILKKRFPHTGRIISYNNIDHPQWLHFCKPYKPKYLPSHRPQFAQVAAQIAASVSIEFAASNLYQVLDDPSIHQCT